jgi:hypothetical protein
MSNEAQAKAIYNQYHDKLGTALPGWLKAPNGKPSHLNEQQWVQVRTPAFKEKVGNWERLVHRDFLNGIPVDSIVGTEIPQNLSKMSELLDWVANDWKKRYGGRATSPFLGEIVIDRTAAARSAGHGIGDIKRKAFYIVPQIIEKGQLLGQLPIEENKPMAFLLGAPVHIADEDFYGLIEVRRDVNMQRLYIHEAVFRDQIKNPPGSVQIAAESAEAVKPHATTGGRIRNILHSIISVNPSSVTIPLDENGEPIFPDNIPDSTPPDDATSSLSHAGNPAPGGRRFSTLDEASTLSTNSPDLSSPPTMTPLAACPRHGETESQE